MGSECRRVVTIQDGKPGSALSQLHVCIAQTRLGMAVCPVDCFYQTEQGVVLHLQTLHWLWLLFLRVSFAAAPPQAGNYGSRGKMDKCTFCAGGPEDDMSSRNPKYGRNRLAEGKLPVCADVPNHCTSVGDGDQVANIFRERIVARGFGSAWGWGTAYSIKS